MTTAEPHLIRIDGLFFRAIHADRLPEVLARNAPDSAGRYHRPGEPALYMSPRADWARIAVSGYMREDGRGRLIVPLRVSGAWVFDQRAPGAAFRLGVDPAASARPWRPAVARGDDAPSWAMSDALRQASVHGLIDVSRHIPEGWHLVLFSWNEGAAPRVRIAGDPVEVSPSQSGPKWG